MHNVSEPVRGIRLELERASLNVSLKEFPLCGCGQVLVHITALRSSNYL